MVFFVEEVVDLDVMEKLKVNWSPYIYFNVNELGYFLSQFIW